VIWHPYLSSYSTPPGFSLPSASVTSRAPGALRRAGTIVRSPLDGRRDKEKVADGDMTIQEVLLPCRLLVTTLLLLELGLWPSSGADLSPDFSRRRLHRRLLANQRGGAHVRRLHGIRQLFPTTGCTHFWVERSDEQTRARRHGSYFRFPAPRNEVLDRQCRGEGQHVTFLSHLSFATRLTALQTNHWRSSYS
jgi:hypothetical protein